MVRILGIVAVFSLMVAPLVFSENSGEESTPDHRAGDIQLDLVGEHLERLFAASGDRSTIIITPDVHGVRGSWNCLAGPRQAGPRQAGPGRLQTAADACDLGRELSRMPPCTRPEDCQALHLWTDNVGPPGVQRVLPPEAPGLLKVVPMQQTAGGEASGSEDVEDDLK